MNNTEINASNRSTTVNTPNSSTIFSTSNRSTTVTASAKRTTMVTTLAVVGFIALVAAGIWLAVYSTRYVPAVVNRVGTAAVYLGSVFTPSPSPSLTVVPTASTTIPFGETGSTTGVGEGSVVSKPVTPAKPLSTTAGEKTSTTQQISGAQTSPVLSGLPDLILIINSIGYLATASTDSFVAASTVPSGNRPAVSFTVKNIGTNVMSSWRFSASIPTQTAYIYQSQPQQSLNPGDSIDYILGFDQPIAGSGKVISVTVNFDHTIGESNTNNNSASAQITILGS